MSITTAARGRARARRAAGVPSPASMFLRGFVKHPKMVGSIVPSSGPMMRRMLAPVAWGEVKLFVEYGPGVGNFSRLILDRLPEGAKLIAIDTNTEFVRYLRHDITDPRFAAVSGSAADVAAIVADYGHAAADYVLSGLPFSTLPAGVGPAIVASTHDILRPGGAFLVYQFSARARDFLAGHFSRIDADRAWLNVPPCHLYTAWKD